MAKKINQKSSISLYKQLANLIRDSVNEGTLKPGMQIPSESELCKKYKISRITVRKAIDLLTKEKILYKAQGKGTYVSYPQFLEDSVAQLHSFSKYNRLQNIPTYTHIVEKKILKTSEKDFTNFNMREELPEEFICIRRLRCIHEKPAILEEDYIPLKYQAVFDTDLENRSLFQLFHDSAGTNPANFSDLIYIKEATQDIASFLELEPGSPILGVFQTVLDNNLNLIYYNVQYIRPDRYTYMISSFPNADLSTFSKE